jgi:hypothetical protein
LPAFPWVGPAAREGTSEDVEGGNGIYRRSEKGENCPAWVTYLVASVR